jgi:hypothetical protein
MPPAAISRPRSPAQPQSRSDQGVDGGAQITGGLSQRMAFIGEHNRHALAADRCRLAATPRHSSHSNATRRSMDTSRRGQRAAYGFAAQGVRRPGATQSHRSSTAAFPSRLPMRRASLAHSQSPDRTSSCTATCSSSGPLARSSGGPFWGWSCPAATPRPPPCTLGPWPE